MNDVIFLKLYKIQHNTKLLTPLPQCLFAMSNALDIQNAIIKTKYSKTWACLEVGSTEDDLPPPTHTPPPLSLSPLSLLAKELNGHQGVSQTGWGLKREV